MPDWPSIRPFAPMHYAMVDSPTQPTGHWIAIDSDGRVLDPFDGSRATLAAYERMHEVVGVWPAALAHVEPDEGEARDHKNEHSIMHRCFPPKPDRCILCGKEGMALHTEPCVFAAEPDEGALPALDWLPPGQRADAHEALRAAKRKPDVEGAEARLRSALLAARADIIGVNAAGFDSTRREVATRAINRIDAALASPTDEEERTA